MNTATLIGGAWVIVIGVCILAEVLLLRGSNQAKERLDKARAELDASTVALGAETDRCGHLMACLADLAAERVDKNEEVPGPTQNNVDAS